MRRYRFRRIDPLGVTTVYERGSGVLVAMHRAYNLPLVRMYTGESSERQGSGRTWCRESVSHAWRGSALENERSQNAASNSTILAVYKLSGAVHVEMRH